MLALFGGAAALIMTVWVGPILRALLLPNTPADPVDLRVLFFTSAAALVTTMLAGLAPVLYATSPDLATALKAGAREGGGSRSVIQTVLLVGQVALTVILLTGAALFIRSLKQVHGLRLGFDAERVMVANANLSTIRPTRTESDAEYQRMRERVAHVPGVVGTALSVGFPFRYSFGTGFSSPGVDSIPDMPGPYISAVSPEYFETIGTRVLRGRGITPADIAGSQRVIVVSELLAQAVWPGKEPIGQCLSIGKPDSPCREVVGIVEDGRQDRVTEPSAQSFIPLAQADDPSLAVPITSLAIRTSGSAERMVGAVRQAIQSSAADLPFVNLEPMEYLFADQVRPWKLGASLFGLFGALALLLGAVGVYGVLSYAMSQRTHELGVRMTLGAQREQLLAMVVGRGVRIALFGVGIGAGGALLAGKALASLVYGISPYDPLNLVIVGLIMVLVAALASLIPAYRVSRIDPMVALRTE
jgi:predicted permease